MAKVDTLAHLDLAEATQILIQGAGVMIMAHDVVKAHPRPLETPEGRQTRVRGLTEWGWDALNIRERVRSL